MHQPTIGASAIETDLRLADPQLIPAREVRVNGESGAGLWAEDGALWKAVEQASCRCGLVTSAGLEFAECLEEAGVLVTSQRKSSMEGWSAPWLQFVKVLQVLKMKHPYSIPLYAILHIWDLPFLDDINGHLSMAQFARLAGVKKATVQKAVAETALIFHTPPRKDQRQPNQKSKMSQSRIAQLA